MFGPLHRSFIESLVRQNWRFVACASELSLIARVQKDDLLAKWRVKFDVIKIRLMQEGVAAKLTSDKIARECTW